MNKALIIEYCSELQQQSQQMGYSFFDKLKTIKKAREKEKNTSVKKINWDNYGLIGYFFSIGIEEKKNVTAILVTVCAIIRDFFNEKAESNAI